MTQNIVSIDFGGVKVLIDSNTKLLYLYTPTENANARSLHDMRDDTAYQVPTDKKATIIYIDTLAFAAGTEELFYADDEDGETNKVALWEGSTLGDEILISEEIPTGKFINVIDNAVQSAGLWIIEEDA